MTVIILPEEYKEKKEEDYPTAEYDEFGKIIFR
jgi:hypothetical protein